MKSFQTACMAIAFITAGISAVMYFGQGFTTWIWQLICMIWIANSYVLERTVNKLNK